MQLHLWQISENVLVGFLDRPSLKDKTDFNNQNLSLVWLYVYCIAYYKHIFSKHLSINTVRSTTTVHVFVQIYYKVDFYQT